MTTLARAAAVLLCVAAGACVALPEGAETLTYAEVAGLPGLEQRPVRFTLDGYGRDVPGTIVFEPTRVSRFGIRTSGIRCAGVSVDDNALRARWTLTCSDGTRATGTFYVDGGNVGSAGAGRTEDGRALRYVVGRRR
jgi:hypothetical protein